MKVYANTTPMKKPVLIFVTVCLFFQSGLAQTCTKTYLKDPLLISLLDEFIAQCKIHNPLYEEHNGGMGVFKLCIYPDDSSEVEKRYELSASLTDSFKENPPQKYAYFRERVILIYEMTGKRYQINPLPKAQLDSLLDEVGDRVYITQTRKGRWVERYYPDGSLRDRNKHQELRFGYSPFDIAILVNKKTGAVRKLKSP